MFQNNFKVNRRLLVSSKRKETFCRQINKDWELSKVFTTVFIVPVGPSFSKYLNRIQRSTGNYLKISVFISNNENISLETATATSFFRKHQ